jgi:hypothetical protein
LESLPWPIQNDVKPKAHSGSSARIRVSDYTFLDQHFASQSFGSRCLLVPAPLQIIILF